MLLFFDLSGLGWMIYNFFMAAGAGIILLVALVVVLVAKGNNGKPLKQQVFFGAIKGALVPFIGGILGMCAHPDFFDRSTRRMLDKFVLLYVPALGIIMIILIVLHVRKIRSQQKAS